MDKVRMHNVLMQKFLVEKVRIADGSYARVRMQMFVQDEIRLL